MERGFSNISGIADARTGKLVSVEDIGLATRARRLWSHLLDARTKRSRLSEG